MTSRPSGFLAFVLCVVLGAMVYEAVDAEPPLPLFRPVYLPLVVSGGAPGPVYCGDLPADDPYRPEGTHAYFADEFDCGRLSDFWVWQGRMGPASYAPPASGIVSTEGGRLSLRVPEQDVSFPYLYLIDDSATSYDVPYTVRRVDWVPGAGDFRLVTRVRFNAELAGEHAISLYADGHDPGWGGPLFYLGSDYGAQEAWRGLIVGADRGNRFVDMGDRGYADPYTDWVVLAADFVSDTLTLSVDATPVITHTLASFKGYPDAATRPDSLYIGSLAMLETPVPWTDIEVDWIRVYVPDSTAPAARGVLDAVVEEPPAPSDPATDYSRVLPSGPFANTPYWSEEFQGTAMPAYWQLVQDPDPFHSWTQVGDDAVAILNDGMAIRVPVWGIFDDMLPESGMPQSLQSPGAPPGESPLEYLSQRGGSPFVAQTDAMPAYSRFDWRPNSGNVRYAWLGRQSADGYGVEISNAGHFPYFTGAMFYILQDGTSDGDNGQFILPSCQEQYFWRLHLLPGYAVPNETWTLVTADYINGTVHLYVDGQEVGWWPQSDCDLNWYLRGENATSPDVLFFGNPATAPAGAWSQVHIDWFATFAGL
jgi:hypothetical protein